MKKITTFFFSILCMLSVANAQEIMLFDFDTANANHVFLETWNGTWPNTAFAKVANPDASGINISANVGKYTSNGGANGELITEDSGGTNVASTIVPQFDFASTPYFFVKVWVNKPVTVSIEMRNAGWYPAFTTKTKNVTAINQWVLLEFDFSDIRFGAPGNYWGYYDRIGVIFDKDLSGGTVANDVYYFDELKLSATSIITGLSSKKDVEFSVYPNPATNFINTPNAQKVTITDLNGRIVKEAFNAEKVDVSSLAKGSYIVKIIIDNNTKIGKLIKE